MSPFCNNGHPVHTLGQINRKGNNVKVCEQVNHNRIAKCWLRTYLMKVITKKRHAH